MLDRYYPLLTVAETQVNVRAYPVIVRGDEAVTLTRLPAGALGLTVPDGLLTRHPIATVPVTVSYRITTLGRDLLGALRMMIDRAETRVPA